VELVSRISNLFDPDPPTSQTERQTDRRTDKRTDDMKSQYARYALVHRAVKIVGRRAMPDACSMHEQAIIVILKIILKFSGGIESPLSPEIYMSSRKSIFSVGQNCSVFTARQVEWTWSMLLAIVNPSVCPSVCPTVRLSHAGTESKRLKLRSWGLHWRIAP